MKINNFILFGNYIEWGEHIIPTIKDTDLKINMEMFDIDNINIEKMVNEFAQVIIRR